MRVPSTRKVVVYVRVSSKGQADGDSRAIQERDCRLYCEMHGGEVAAVREDIFTGYESFEERNGLRDALDMVNRGEADTIVAWRVNRAGREVIDNLLILREVSQAGGFLDICGVGNIPNTAIGRAVLNALSAAGDIEREAIILRTGSARRARAERGELLAGGTSHYGYIFEGKRKEAYAIDPEAAPVVQDIFNWADAGEATRAIARKLNARGVLTPSALQASRGQNGKRRIAKVWRGQAVVDILKWRGYTGEHSSYARENKKVKVMGEDGRLHTRIRKQVREAGSLPVSIPSLISHEQFERVNSSVKARMQDSAQDDPDAPLLTRGIAYCGICGAKMTVGRHGQTGHRQYLCSMRPHVVTDPAKVCAGGGFALKAEDVDKDVWAKAKEIAKDDARFQRLLDSKMGRLIEKFQQTQRERDNILTELAEQEEAQTRWVRRIGAEVDDEKAAVFSQELTQTLANIKQLKVRAAAVDMREGMLETLRHRNTKAGKLVRDLLTQHDEAALLLAVLNEEVVRLEAERNGTPIPDPLDTLSRMDKRLILRTLDVQVLMYPRNSEYAKTHETRWDFTFSDDGTLANGTRTREGTCARGVWR